MTGITLNETSITLLPGETSTLTVTIEPSNASNPVVYWSSSNGAIATIDQAGKVTAVSPGSCTVTCHATGNSEVYAECQVTVEMEWVDLGLPGGTLWATCNVGASSPEEYGDYFAWGETESKDNYSPETYKWSEGSYNTMTKYCSDSNYGYNGFTDNLTELESIDDAATANWGNNWQIPSKVQFQQLFNAFFTTSKWTSMNGVYGWKITSNSNGKSIFLPAAGYRSFTNLKDVGSGGSYWSRTYFGSTYPEKSWNLIFVSGNTNIYNEYRHCGLSIRPVRKN